MSINSIVTQAGRGRTLHNGHTGCSDIFEIVAVYPYPSDYDAVVEQEGT